MSATSARLPSPFSWRGALSASVNLKQTALSVMDGLVPAIHAAPLPANPKLFRRLDNVDDRDKPGHDGVGLLSQHVRATP